MKRFKQRWYLTTIVLVTLAIPAIAVAPFKKVTILSSTPSATTSSTTSTEAPTTEAEETKSDNATSADPTKNSKLTGIPQIDYIWDPNLPRELRGYNLSSYPFFSTVPPEDDIHFKCDGLHDGFYASIEHKCQVYHHCVYGIRHDFLCANFTAFDQRTFICHFVSDVDCEGSPKYWNRNDALYMATTTTSTTTTTTEPPPTPRRRLVRPLRPLRRPTNRRPVDDYYYDEEEYDDDYYEERMNARRKQRPRQRKPQLEYDDEYEEKRAFSDDEKPRRHHQRDRFKDSEPDIEDDYENDRPKNERPKARNKANVPAERRKSGARRPVSISGRSGADERRSFGDEKPSNTRKDKLRPTLDDAADSETTNPRRSGTGGRRRANEKRPVVTAPPTADLDDLDYYEKPQHAASGAHDQVDDTVDEDAQTKTTPKPLEEFITPKASAGSVYARPRAPPRIARPVPVNAKKKFDYPVQKTTATTVSPTAAHADTDEYEEYADDYVETAPAPVRPRAPSGRRRAEDDAADSAALPATGRRRFPVEGRKHNRNTLRKPTTEKRPLIADSDDYDASNERHEGRARKRPHSGGGRPRAPLRGADDIDFVDDDYDSAAPPHPRPAHRLRPKTLARKGAAKLRTQTTVDEDEEPYADEPELPARQRLNANSGRHRLTTSGKQKHTTATTAPEAAAHDEQTDTDEDAGEAVSSNSKAVTTADQRLSRPTSISEDARLSSRRRKRIRVEPQHNNSTEASAQG